MIKPYYNSADFTLYKGDSLELLSQMDTKVDMIFADSPKGRAREEQDEFNFKWLSASCNRLKETGTIWICCTHHDIFSVERCLERLGFKIINMIVWQKPDAPQTQSDKHFNFCTEHLIWATRQSCKDYTFNQEALMKANGGTRMPDVWKIPSTGTWERTCGKHPAQKPLRLLYRAILASTHEGDTILDPFAGSSTTGIAANLMSRNYIGIETKDKHLMLSLKRKELLTDPSVFSNMKRRMEEASEEVMVLINHARPDLKAQMIRTGICYTRIGESKGSILVTYGYERMQYVLLHTNGTDAHLYRLRSKGTFQIWTKETLIRHGFCPQSSPYYAVFLFDNSVEYPVSKNPQLPQLINSYRAKIRPLADVYEYRIHQ